MGLIDIEGKATRRGVSEGEKPAEERKLPPDVEAAMLAFWASIAAKNRKRGREERREVLAWLVLVVYGVLMAGADRGTTRGELWVTAFIFGGIVYFIVAS